MLITCWMHFCAFLGLFHLSWRFDSSYTMEINHAVCPYCRVSFGGVNDALCHSAAVHPEENLSYMYETVSSSKIRYKQRTFKVLGCDVTSKINDLRFDELTGKLLIPTSAAVESPVRKLQKINTPSKSVHCQLYTHEEKQEVNYLEPKSDDNLADLETLSEQLNATNLSADQSLNVRDQFETLHETGVTCDILAEPDEIKTAVAELHNLLPSVTSHLAENGRLEEWISFFRLIDSGDFNVNHISAQLFLDVLKFTTVNNVREMRYTPEVKRFWTTGKCLFKSKFLRFMGGFKVFSNNDDECEKRAKTMSKTDISRINFVCPNKAVLSEERKFCAVDCKTPGIIYSNIETVTNSSVGTKAFNLCVDGKKIAPGFGKYLGDVNLFGHESEPTFRSKVERFEVEMQVIDTAKEQLVKWIERDVDTVSELTQDSKQILYVNILDILSINTDRLKELRRLKVKRQLALDKLMKMASEPWQKSKYSFAISSIKTHLHDINRCIQDILELNTKLGLAAAACNNAESAFSLNSVVELQHQENYVCLNPANQANGIVSTEYIKQRSEQWHRDRNSAKVTGSTVFKALGLSTLKEQQEHYDRVQVDAGNDSNLSNETTDAMRHGIENEINAVGTLVGRILPIFGSSSKFQEEGYYTIPHECNASFLVVSPDGSCREKSGIQYAVEIKCPVPNKQYTTDVHYEIPKYYVTQILAEMFALKCNHLLFVSWTPESTTVMKATFDADLWNRIQKELELIYCGSSSTRPTKKRPAVSELSNDLVKYVNEKVSLLLEVQSNVSAGCLHNYEGSPDILTFPHESTDDRQKQACQSKIQNLRLPYMMSVLARENSCLGEVYNILRVPAKEVLVAVLSDLDRESGPGHIHGIPIAYGLAGYSLKLQCMRSLMEEIITECDKNGVHIKSLSTDGQFYRLCVRDKSDRPLTILQLAKDTWERVKKMPKSDQVKQLLELNVVREENRHDVCRELNSNLHLRTILQQSKSHEPIVVFGWKNRPWPLLYNPRKLSELIRKNKSNTKLESTSIDLDTMPADVADALIDIIGDDNIDEESATDNDRSGITVDSSATDANDANDVADSEENQCGEQEPMDIVADVEACVSMDYGDTRVDVNTLSFEVLSDTVTALKYFDDKRKKAKWKSFDTEKLRNMLKAEPFVLMKHFSKAELIVCAERFQNRIESTTNKQLNCLTKLELVNAFSVVFGCSKILTAKKSPPKLTRILKDIFSKHFSKEALNAITATRLFLEQDLPKWRKESVFKDGINIGHTDVPYVWYSQPEYFDSVEQYIVYLLDCHHLFVNARSYVCQHDISGLNVKRKAWVNIAESSDSLVTGLNKAMVVDLIDRQSNAIAQIVFSEQVEEKMVERGWTSEAHFCKCMREWYRAEDEAGLDIDTRYKYRMNIRQLFLESVNFADFPPPGSHIAGMPLVMFEGILTNIDRRYQLHALVPGNAYNVRAPNTLSVENLFGGFQDLDPKSSGVLLPDDIPHAIETASYLIKTRLDPDRSFEMRTTKSSKVYPAATLHAHVGYEETDEPTFAIPAIGTLPSIPVRPHAFDKHRTERAKPKRKKGSIPDYRMPSRGTQPVRQHHKADSSKILPHVRHGLIYDA